jgi:hypothetical protein
MQSHDELLDNGGASPVIPAAELPTFYRAFADQLRREAADPSKSPEMRDAILKSARQFDDLAGEVEGL